MLATFAGVLRQHSTSTFGGRPNHISGHPYCAVSDRVRDVLVDLLVAAGLSVIAERPGSHRQMTTFRAAEGLALLKSPDLAHVGFDGPGSFTLVDVKVVDPAAPSYCSRLTGREVLGRQSELERAGRLAP